MEKIGVIGAGVMGSGVAVDLLINKKDVVLIDINDEILEHARKEIINGIKYAHFMNVVSNLDTKQLLTHLTLSTSLDDVAHCEFIIENVTENWDIKKEIYEKLDKICKPNVCFAANTSCISITKIGGVINRPDKLIGMHFMNPVCVKKAVEVIRAMYTSQITIEISKKLLKSIGKSGIIVNDYPGFVANRLSHLFMNEAAFLVQDQVALPKQIDEIFKKCYGHTMGPLETADLIGLDTVVNSLNVLYESYQDPKFRCCPLIRKMVDGGMLGRKSGEGFYDYKNKKEE